MHARVVPGAEPFRFDAGPVGALLQHGFTGSPASLRPLGQWLADRGVSSIGPRLPGHGTRWEELEETTWQDWEREAEGALRELASRCSTVFAVGLSMGGALVLRLAARHPEIEGLVLVNPDIRRPSLALAPLARLFTRTLPGVGNDIRKPGQDELAYDRVPLRALVQLARLYRAARRDLPRVRVPLLVFASAQDHVVRPSNSRYVLARAGSERKELVTLVNSYHVATLDFDAETIFERTLAFGLALADRASSPS